MSERYIVAVNVERDGKIIRMGALWNGTSLVTVRGKAVVLGSAEEAESLRFFVTCKYPLMVGRIEVVKLEDDSEWRYHLRGGEEIKTE